MVTGAMLLPPQIVSLAQRTSVSYSPFGGKARAQLKSSPNRMQVNEKPEEGRTPFRASSFRYGRPTASGQPSISRIRLGQSGLKFPKNFCRVDGLARLTATMAIP